MSGKCEIKTQRCCQQSAQEKCTGPASALDRGSQGRLSLGGSLLEFLSGDGRGDLLTDHWRPRAQGDVLRPRLGAREVWPRRRRMRDLLPEKAEPVAGNVEIANLHPLLPPGIN